MSTPQVIGEIRGRSEDVLLVKGGWSRATYVTPGGSFHSFCLNKTFLHLVVSRSESVPKALKDGLKNWLRLCLRGRARMRDPSAYLWGNVYALARSLARLHTSDLSMHESKEEHGLTRPSPPHKLLPSPTLTLRLNHSSKHLTCPEHKHGAHTEDRIKLKNKPLLILNCDSCTQPQLLRFKPCAEEGPSSLCCI